MRIAVEGAELFFDVDGAQLVPAEGWLVERPTVLLLHEGRGLDHAAFKARLGPALTAVAQVVYLDLRGHGRSSGASRSPPDVDRLADDVAAFCELLEVVRPIVLGQGLGSLVALRLARRHAGLVDALVLVGPALPAAAGEVGESVEAVDVPVLTVDRDASEAIDDVLALVRELHAEQVAGAE